MSTSPVAHGIACPYCTKPAPLVTGREVYPHRKDLYAKNFYQCAPCDAVVGCHPGTTNPLGRLANAELRKAKQRVHAVFDPHWKIKGKSRGSCYRRLANDLGIALADCHVGMFDVATCERAVDAIALWNLKTVCHRSADADREMFDDHGGHAQHNTYFRDRCIGDK